MDSLADRIEALDGPDREIDLEIHSAITGSNWRWNDRRPEFESIVYGEAEPDSGGYNDTITYLPKYSASVDAALILVPNEYSMGVQQRRSFEGFYVSLRHDRGHATGEPTFYDAKAKTFPLAICAAALRARE